MNTITLVFLKQMNYIQQLYIEQLEMIVSTLHEVVGVIHMDLYPSNIIWKVENNKMKVM